jgi:HEAT repeat protein
MRRLGDAIGLREGEGRSTARLFGFVLSLMVAIALAKAAQRGLFLSTHTRAEIPDAFVVSALCLAAASFAVSALAARLGPARLLQLLFAVVALALIGCRVALSLAGSQRIAAFAVYVVVEVAAGLLVAQTWSLAASAVDARSAKRLLPLVGNASAVAWALGGFAVAPLVAVVGTPALLPVAAGLLLVSFGVAGGIARRDLSETARGSRGQGLWAGARAGLGYVRREPLLRTIAVLTVVGLLVEQLLDYQLFAAAQAHYSSAPDRIAAFMGTFYGVTGTVALLGAFVAGRVLSRFGSARITAAESVAVVAGSAVFFLVPEFAVIVGVRAVHRVFKQTLCSPARAQMQTPIPGLRRAQAAALLKGVLAPLFYAVGAVVLKTLPPDLELRWIALACGGIAAVAVAVSLVRLERAYLGALRRSIDHRRLDLAPRGGRAPALDRDQCAVLADELRSQDPERAVLAASLLAAGAPASAGAPLAKACGHSSGEVRLAAAEALGRVGTLAHAPAVTRALALAAGAAEEQVFLRTLVALDPSADALDAVLLARTGGAAPRALALARACRAESDPTAEADLVRMLRAPTAATRAAAAWATGEARSRAADARTALAVTLSDDDRDVRDAALRAAGRLGDSIYAPAIVRALASPESAGAAADAIAALPDATMDAIAEAARDARVAPLCRLAAALASGGGERGDEVLVELLGRDHRVVRYRAARALAARRGAPGWRAPPRDVVARGVRAELETGYGYYALVVGIARTDGVDDFEVEPQYEFLADEVRLRIRQTERRLFALLALIADPSAVRVVQVQLRRRRARDVAHAVEYLEHALDPELARLVVPFFEPRPLRLRLAAVGDDFDLPEESQRDPLAAILRRQDPHLRRCALWSYRDRAEREHAKALQGEIDMLPVIDRIHSLRRVPVFRELTAEDVTQVALITERVELPAGQIIFHKSDPGDVLYVVVDGRVAVRDGARDIAHIGAGEFFGELALLDDEPRSADAVCAEDSALLRIAGPDLEELMERRPQIAREIVRVLARRLRAATQRLGASGPVAKAAD